MVLLSIFRQKHAFYTSGDAVHQRNLVTRGNAYVKNEFTHRPTNAQRIPPNLNMSETLYGFKPRRDGWVPKPLLERASKIPYIGLKR